MVSIRERAAFFYLALRQGIRLTLRAVQFIALAVGGSLIAYFAFALKRPDLTVFVLAGGLALTFGEGAFRLYGAVVASRQKAEEDLAALVEGAPQLSFGRAEIPKYSQPYDLRWGDGEGFQEPGRVIRVPVTNALGARTARHVHARLTFQPDDRHSAFSPKHPVSGEWDVPSGFATEIDLPGNGSPKYLNVIFIRDRPYPHAFAWTHSSRAAGLAGHVIKSNAIAIKIEVMASGPTQPLVSDILRVECRPKQMLVADWDSRNRDEEGNNVEWWDGQEM